MSRPAIAIVGGGPSCTYVLERLASLLGVNAAGASLDIHVFEKTGEFGAGAVHSAKQPETSFLNRIVGQVSFAADETVIGAENLLAAKERPTLHEWCQLEFERTGDERFNLRAEDWPKRFMHGLALTSQFDRYTERLRALPDVGLHLHHSEVVDIEDLGQQLQLVTAEGLTVVDQVLFVTGHSINRSDKYPQQSAWASAARSTGSTFVRYAYPLEANLSPETVAPGATVACWGAGLTAIDIALFLSEARGGTFRRRDDGALEYQPSGREPSRIAMVSGAGLFTFARPFNAKQVDLVRYEHRGRFLTEHAIDQLRESAGVPIAIGGSTVRQLDFVEQVFPLVTLEMTSLYFATLFGPELADHLGAGLQSAYDRFLHSPTPAEAVALLRDADAAVQHMAAVVERFLESDHETRSAIITDVDVRPAARRFLQVLYSPSPSPEEWSDSDAAAAEELFGTHAPSPWGHSLRPTRHRFSWHEAIDPLSDTRYDGVPYAEAVQTFMRRDHLAAAQGNLLNPSKAAADGVWRDLRPVLGHAVDFGGLTAASHREFIGVYMRHHNRLANGAALEVMEKMLALVEAGIVDLGVGPSGRIDATEDGLIVHGPLTGAEFRANVVVDARVHPFDAEADESPLYGALLDRGLVRVWENPSQSGRPYRPGGLDLSPEFHPRRESGAVDSRLTFLGPPSEGVMFFQLGALRPQQNHHVMQDILSWISHLETKLLSA